MRLSSLFRRKNRQQPGVAPRPFEQLEGRLLFAVGDPDDDVLPPVIEFFAPVADGLIGNDGTASRFYRYSAFDPSGVSNTNWQLTRDTGSGPEVILSALAAPREGTIDIAPFGLGTFRLTVTATDNDTDDGDLSDRSTASASRSITIVDDDTAGPLIVFSQPNVPVGNDGTLPRRFLFTVNDGSLLSSASYSLTRDTGSGPVEIATGAVNLDSNTVDIAPYGTGAFTLTVTATDGDADRDGDASTSTLSRSITITDDDTTGPLIVFSEPNVPVGNDGTTPRRFEFTVNDSSLLSSASYVLTRDTGSGPVEIATGPVNLDSNTVDIVPFGLGAFTLTVTATDGDADWAGDASTTTRSHSITIVDDDTTAPTIAFYRPTATNLPEGAERVFEYEAIDASGIASVSYVLTRGTEVVATGTGPQRGTVDFSGMGFGTFTLTVTAVDGDADRPDDSTSGTASKTVVVVEPTPPPPPPPPPSAVAELRTDPSNPSRRALFVNGTSGSDFFIVAPIAAYGTAAQKAAHPRGVQVFFNGASQGIFDDPSRVIVYGNAGDDRVWVAGTTPDDDYACSSVGGLALPTWVFGGDGNDIVKGGNAGGVVVGGRGKDVVIGGLGRDILIGGFGADGIVGHGSDDILVAGYTAYDDNLSGLDALHREWARGDRTYTTRVSALRGTTTGLNGGFVLRTDGAGSLAQTVFDDSASDEVDVLAGTSGQDWFLYNTGADGGRADLVLDGATSEVRSDIDAT